MKRDSTDYFIPLEHETRPTVTTAAAAFYLCRQPQTLRIWACKEDGPIRPIRVHGRLAWRVSDIRQLLNIGSVSQGAWSSSPSGM